MPDENPMPPPELPPEAAATPPAAPIPFDIGEEFGTAKKNLPPVKILIVCVVAIAIIGAIFSYIQRPRTHAAGSIDDVVAVEIPNQNSVMVAINVSFQNHGKKVFKIHNMTADLETASGTLSDDAASGADFDRYFQAFPELKQHALPALKAEDKIAPEASAQGTIVVSFPVTKDAFASRKSLKVSIWPYDETVALVLSK
jgi:hypothetical protein